MSPVSTELELLERDAELAAVDEALEVALAGRGTLLVLEGAGGIGKTRLLGSARAKAEELGLLVLAARGSELERAFAFGVVRQLFDGVVASERVAPRADLFAGAAAGAEPVVADIVAATQTDETAPSFATLYGLYWLTYTLASRKPLALLIDDAHWADPASLRFLDFLRTRIEGLPILVAVAARSGEGWAPELELLRSDPLAHIVRPAPLSPEATTVLLRQFLAREPEAEFANACAQATAGNPFLLRELGKELAAEGIEPTAAGARAVVKLKPDAVAHSVLLRLSRLSDAATALARSVAILGDGAELRTAAALAGLDADQAGAAADELAQAEILAHERPLAFLHPLVLTTVYWELRPADRAREHRKAASLLRQEGAPATRLALHLLQIEPHGDRSVVSTLREAARAAAATGAPETAAAYLRRALAEPPEPADRADILLDLGSAEKDAGEPAALDHLLEGLELADDPHRVATAALHFSRRAATVLRIPEALEVLERALRGLPPEDDLAARLEAHYVAEAQLGLSTAPLARGRLRVKAPPSDPQTLGECELLAVHAFDRALAGEPADEVAALAEHALDSPPGRDARFLNTPSYYRAIQTLLATDRLDSAGRSLDLAIAEARARGSAVSFALASTFRSHAALRRGDVLVAESEARAALDAATMLGWLAFPPAAAELIEALTEQGSLAEAEQVLEHNQLHAELEREDVLLIWLLYSRGRLRLAQARPAEGIEDLLEVGRRKETWGPGFDAWPWASTVAPALAAAGELTQALQLLEEEGARARGYGTPRAAGRVLRARALIEGGEEGIPLLCAALEAFDRSPGRLDRARARVELGAALRRLGRRSDARDLLAPGYELAHACGAGALEEAARQELLALGARPRRAVLSGPESLTATERRVAGMAADGLANAEIAQSLFVTVKTVETHLSSAYRKLGIGSRRELARALHG